LTNTHTNKQTPLKTSNAVCDATTLGNKLFASWLDLYWQVVMKLKWQIDHDEKVLFILPIMMKWWRNSYFSMQWKTRCL